MPFTKTPNQVVLKILFMFKMSILKPIFSNFPNNRLAVIYTHIIMHEEEMK